MAVERDSRAPNPAWHVAVFVAGLILLFVGERVVPTYETLRTLLAALGVGSVLAMLALRLISAGRYAGERRRVERRLGLLMIGGVVVVATYFATTPAGMRLLGLALAPPDVRARFEGAATVAYIALTALTVLPLVLGEMALAPMRRAPRVEGRRVMSAVVSGASLAAATVYASLLCFGVGVLDVRADYSYYRTAGVSDSTVKIAQSVTDEVEIVAFFPQLNEVGIEVEGYLKDLQGRASNVRVEVIDGELNPARATEKKVTSDGVIVLSRGESVERLPIGVKFETAANKLKKLDSDIQQRLLKLLRKQRTAYFTVGHGERAEPSQERDKDGKGIEIFKGVLRGQNYQIKDLSPADLVAKGVPEDAAIVIVLGPTAPFEAAAVENLKAFADRAGKLILALDPEGGAALDDLAAIAGLTYQGDPLADDEFFIPIRRNPSDRQNLLIDADPRRGGGFSSHASVSTLSRTASRARLAFRASAAFLKAEGAAPKVDFVVRAGRATFADQNGNFEADEGETRGIKNVAAASSLKIAPALLPAPPEGAQEAAPNEADGEMRAFVVGDADSFADDVMRSRDHQFFAFDAIRWLGGEESFAGMVTTTEDIRIEHTQEQDKLWFYGMIGGAPSLVLGFGLWFVGRERRRRRQAPSNPRSEKRNGSSERPAESAANDDDDEAPHK